MKKQNHSEGRSAEIGNQITRRFGDLPIVDAKNDMRLVILHDDISKAKRQDFENCVFARACKRQYDSKKVLLMRTIAYISIPNEEGEQRVERFIISTKGRELIKKYDKGEKIEPGTSFVFKAPSPSMTLEAKRKKSIEAYHNRDKKSEEGEISDENSSKEKTSRKKEVMGSVNVRNGTGLVQMKRSKANEEE